MLLAVELWLCRLTLAAAFLVTSVFPSLQHPWETTDRGHWAAGGDCRGARPEEASGLTPEQARATSTDALQLDGPRLAGAEASCPYSLLSQWNLEGAGGPQTLLMGPNPPSSHGETEGLRRKRPSRKGPGGWLWWHAEGQAQTGCSRATPAGHRVSGPT